MFIVKNASERQMFLPGNETFTIRGCRVDDSGLQSPVSGFWRVSISVAHIIQAGGGYP